MTDDPMQQVANLGRAMKEKAQELGLEQQTFVAVPDLSDEGSGIHIFQAMFVLPATPDPDLDALAGIMEATAQDERTRLRELAAEAAAKKLKEREADVLEAQRQLDEGGSFL